jgi:ketosteroid isomerase-like protein
MTVTIMKHQIFVVIVAWLAASAAAQSGGRETDREAVQRVFEQYIQSVKTADAALAAEIWSHAADIVVVTPFGRFEGWDSVRETIYVNFLQKAFSERSLEPSNVAIRVAGDTAWSVFDWTFAGKTPDGQTISSKGWESHIYQRTRTGWTIVALHYSVPPPPPR